MNTQAQTTRGWIVITIAPAANRKQHTTYMQFPQFLSERRRLRRRMPTQPAITAAPWIDCSELEELDAPGVTGERRKSWWKYFLKNNRLLDESGWLSALERISNSSWHCGGQSLSTVDMFVTEQSKGRLHRRSRVV
jgi:hypothetical protein